MLFFVLKILNNIPQLELEIFIQINFKLQEQKTENNTCWHRKSYKSTQDTVIERWKKDIEPLILSLSSFTFLLVPHCQHSEYEGTEGGSKEAPPVVPHGKKR